MQQPKLLAMLADVAAGKKLSAGHVLFEMGDPASTMYVVRSGELRIQIGDLVFETVVEGGIVGEMALLDDQTHVRSATVVALSDCEVVEISREQLLQLVHAQPDVTLEFCKVMIRRLRKTTVLTYHDSITNLPNRFRFQELCRTALVRAKRQNGSVGVLFVDVDHFQSINESLGFALGDELLNAVAGRLRETLGDAHPVARLLADGFGVLLEDMSATHEHAAVADQILGAFARPLVLGGKSHYVTVSIGVSVFPQDGNDPDELLRSAESATGRAQDAGGNSYQFYSSALFVLAVEALHLRNGLRQAIERNQFHLGYQPRVDVSSGRIKGLEVLLRWNHPELGVIPPAKFIPIAEQAGIIDTIGDWVLRAACKQMVTWLAGGLNPFRLAVNVSARQLRRADFSQRIGAILKETGMQAGHLELEITESTLMQDPERAVVLLKELRTMGVLVTLDDFGIEYSSLGYLKHFPLDYMKIDQSFMRGIPTARDDVAIAKAIITLAKNLGLRVIAEGVETGKQLAFLVDQRCEEYQGYLFSRPMLADQIEPLLRANLGN